MCAKWASSSSCRSRPPPHPNLASPPRILQGSSDALRFTESLYAPTRFGPDSVARRSSRTSTPIRRRSSAAARLSSEPRWAAKDIESLPMYCRLDSIPSHVPILSIPSTWYGRRRAGAVVQTHKLDVKIVRACRPARRRRRLWTRRRPSSKRFRQKRAAVLPLRRIFTL